MELKDNLSKILIPWVGGFNIVIKLKFSSIGEMRNFVNEAIRKETATADVIQIGRISDNLHNDAHLIPKILSG